MSTDPMSALLACRAAWERSQPQTFLDLYPDNDMCLYVASPIACCDPGCPVHSDEYDDALSGAGKDNHPCPPPPGTTEGVPVCAHADTDVTQPGPPWYDGPPAQRHQPGGAG